MEILMFLGGVLALVGGIWFIVAAFMTGILWGLLVLLVPFASIIWLITHWEEGKAPFGLIVLGIVLHFIGGG